MREELSLLRKMAEKMIETIDHISKKYEHEDRVPTLDEYLAMHYDVNGSFPGLIKSEEELTKEYEEKYGNGSSINKLR